MALVEPLTCPLFKPLFMPLFSWCDTLPEFQVVSDGIPVDADGTPVVSTPP